MSIVNLYRETGSATIDQLEEAEYMELLDLKTVVDDDIGHIAAQLSQARADRLTNGEYADPQWYHRATTAKRIKGQLSQRIQNEIRRRKMDRPTPPAKGGGLKALLRAIDLVLDPEQKRLVIAKWKEMGSS
jgi:hypothetical protein